MQLLIYSILVIGIIIIKSVEPQGTVFNLTVSVNPEEKGKAVNLTCNVTKQATAKCYRGETILTNDGRYRCGFNEVSGYPFLEIKNLTINDEQEGLYSIRNPDVISERCNFNVFLCSNFMYRSLTVYVDGNQFTDDDPTGSPEKITLRGNPSSTSLSYSFRIEALPLESQILDVDNVTNVTINRACVPIRPQEYSPKCLYNEGSIRPRDCAKSITIKSKYQYSRKDLDYDGICPSLNANTDFTTILTLLYPPQAEISTNTSEIVKFNDTIDITYRVTCANPETYLDFFTVYNIENGNKMKAVFFQGNNTGKTFRTTYRIDEPFTKITTLSCVRNDPTDNSYNCQTRNFYAKKGLSAGAIAGIVIGCVVGVVIIVLVIFLIVRCVSK